MDRPQPKTPPTPAPTSPPVTSIWRVIGTVLLWLLIANVVGWFLASVTRIDYSLIYWLIVFLGLLYYWKIPRIRNGFIIVFAIPLCALLIFFLLVFYPPH